MFCKRKFHVTLYLKIFVIARLCNNWGYFYLRGGGGMQSIYIDWLNSILIQSNVISNEFVFFFLKKKIIVINDKKTYLWSYKCPIKKGEKSPVSEFLVLLYPNLMFRKQYIHGYDKHLTNHCCVMEFFVTRTFIKKYWIQDTS